MVNKKKSWFKRLFCCRCKCNEIKEINLEVNSSIGGGGIKNPNKKDEEGN